MVIQLMDKKAVRKPRNVYVNPDILYKAHVEALRLRKPLGEWLEEAIEQRLEREQEKPK